MSKLKARLMTAAVIAIALPVYAGVSAAAPISGTLAIQNAAPSNVQDVRYYGGGWRGGGWRGGGWGRGWGWGGVGAGLAAGAIIGGALAAPYYYGGGYYGGGPYYANPYYAQGPGPGYYDDEGGGGDAVAYCMQRYRSYDPRSGTFMGNDGYRHPCP